ncbi:P-loop containing nucleoside triphosphate hydrolase protein [Mycotypha africana]|uniref:P-loop containing nucleoside triphosphate hydrolase protein n=1 Tax=Mycotypha africana TaxID=64632 RepID=UPI0023012EB5|nr:P-loop containing nucleoside triphosphate hydrolase protein [Mycotypha africana]KAI8988337.1 P-loop containing nucleoside triphosphate hydrolase protein [Mycotypha africana]
MSHQHQHGRPSFTRKRKTDYIPDERYDVDGTLIKNTEALKKKRWDLRDIIKNPEIYEEALKKAQAFLKEKKNQKDSIFYDTGHNRQLWTEETDSLFFSRKDRGLVAWFLPRGSPIYYEFEGFYSSLKDNLCKDKQLLKYHKSERMNVIRQEGEMIRHAVVLFHDFQTKKREKLKKQIEETRAALPVTPFANAIVQTLKQHRVLLIAGDTGCGKSTQVPQILLNAGFKKIACTQPRRIACSSLARRVSYETLNEYGTEIAYQVRFEGTKTNRTRILFLTEGLLLRQYAADDMLSMYDVIVVDEVHERHMMGDFLLALLKKTLAKRNDLYLVLMSATINAELFAQYFDAPTLVIPGKMYSVKVHYWAMGDEDKNLINDAAYRKRQADPIKKSIPSRSEVVKAAQYIKVLDYIDQSAPVDERGDLLIFMSGINEIASLAEQLTEYTAKSKKWIILMLHSSLTVEDQEKVFDSPPEGVRKCIISSNIAETSITIDGIRFIIDSGKVKEMHHDPNSKLSRLSEFWISKASAKQRTGRAGRTGPGECFRFYSEDEFNHLNDFAVPEIQRETLEPLLLQIKSLGFGDPRRFDFVESPSIEHINSSMKFLYNLGAIDAHENLLGLGSVLAKLPVDVIVGKMLILGVVFNIVDPILTIAASMSVQSPFTRVTQFSNRDYLQNRNTFDSKDGDPFTMLNLWQNWIEIKAAKMSSRKWCRQHLVEEHRLYEITKMKRQFEKVLNDFQPGLLEALRFLGDDGSDEEESNKNENHRKRDVQERLRREKFEEKSNKRRRTLTMGNIGDEGIYEQEDDYEKMDIRELEFTLMNNIRQLRSRAHTLSEREIQIIKLILCSSLYPQFAIGDEHNPYRKSNELIFHTQAKSFLSIHPSSVFSNHAELIQGHTGKERKDDKTVEESLYQQLLCYLQLLETNKPFIVNLTRIPGIHALLMFGKTIDINTDCSVIVVDSYFVIKFRTTQVAEFVLYLSYQLRSEWNELLNLRISHGLGQSSDEQLGDIASSPSIRDKLPLCLKQILDDEQRKHTTEKHMRDMWTPETEAHFQRQTQLLNRKLADFMETAISAELKVAKASELMKMYPKYIEPERTPEEQNYPRVWSSDDVIRSGIQLTPYMYYDSINEPSCASAIPESADSIPTNIKSFWFCQECQKMFSFNKEEARNHIMLNHLDEVAVGNNDDKNPLQITAKQQ